jgi:hypothetical protein
MSYKFKLPDMIKKSSESPAPVAQLIPVIQVSQEAKIRRILVQSQPRQIVFEVLSQKKKKKKS